MSLEKINHDEFPSTETILKVNHDALKRGGLDLEMDHVVSVIGHHRLKASLAKTDQSLSLSDTFAQSWMNLEPSGRRVFLVNAGRHILFSNLYRKVLVTEPFRGPHGMSGAALTGEGRQDVNMGCNFWFENPKEMIRNGQVKESHAGEMMSCAEQGEEQTSMGRLGVYMAARKKT